MNDNGVYQTIAIGIILLFISTGSVLTSASAVEPPVLLESRNPWFYVGGSGPGNYTRIQDAIDNASDGDTVFVFDESAPYHEFLVINKSITVLGEEPSTTILNGSGAPREVVSVTADHVTISGFSIINYGRDAIRVQANHTRITQNLLGPNISGWSGQGIELFHSNNSVIEENEINGTFDCIQLYSSHNNSIRKNLLTSSWIHGIWLSESTQNTVEGNIIDTGELIGMPGSYTGIRLTFSQNNLLVNNTITSHDEDCVNGMMLWESYDNIVTGNIFTSCGLDWYGSYENTVKDNMVNLLPLFYLIDQPETVITAAGQVILIRCPDSTIQNVTISSTPKAIALMESERCHVTNCTCRHNTYGVYTETSEESHITENVLRANELGIAIGAGSAHTRIMDNDIQESLYTGISSNAAFVTLERNRVVNNTWGIMITGLFSIYNHVTANNLTQNWDGVVLSSFFTTVNNNTITENSNGIHITGGSSRNHILSNEISLNERGINITHEPKDLWSMCNWIQKNNFIGNTRHVSFDSSLNNHFIRNYWEKDFIPPHRIDGTLSFYKIHPWTGGITWEKHLPWMDFDLIPATEPYPIQGMH
ncbi:MAG: NosD domain-containing protein [Candidatus Thermoplasmatota archaeon]